MSAPAVDKLRLADQGRGPLLQRDYWGVVQDCRLDAPGVARVIAESFADFPPPEIARFAREGSGLLEKGDELTVEIRMAGTCGVCVLHRDDHSLTLGTLDGHPEAGRITFGAYPNDDGEVVVHIRSRARAATRARLVGFLFAGDPMQTLCWTDFLNRLAVAVGEGIRGTVHTETHEVDEEADDVEARGPTFRAYSP